MHRVPSQLTVWNPVPLVAGELAGPHRAALSLTAALGAFIHKVQPTDPFWLRLRLWVVGTPGRVRPPRANTHSRCVYSVCSVFKSCPVTSLQHRGSLSKRRHPTEGQGCREGSSSSGFSPRRQSLPNLKAAVILSASHHFHPSAPLLRTTPCATPLPRPPGWSPTW